MSDCEFPTGSYWHSSCLSSPRFLVYINNEVFIILSYDKPYTLFAGNYTIQSLETRWAQTWTVSIWTSWELTIWHFSRAIIETAKNTGSNLIIFYLTRSCLGRTIYHTRSEHTYHYTTDALIVVMLIQWNSPKPNI
jgi:hypothetical protein